MTKSGILFAFVVLFAGVSVSLAQDDVGARMSLERIANIRAGTYAAGDQIRFRLIAMRRAIYCASTMSPRSTLSTPIMVRWADSC